MQLPESVQEQDPQVDGMALSEDMTARWPSMLALAGYKAPQQ